MSFGNAGGLKKNPLGIAVSLEYVWNQNEKLESLIKLIDKVIHFAERSNAVSKEQTIEHDQLEKSSKVFLKFIH